jgi:hypothetical protein
MRAPKELTVPVPVIEPAPTKPKPEIEIVLAPGLKPFKSSTGDALAVTAATFCPGFIAAVKFAEIEKEVPPRIDVMTAPVGTLP